MNLVRVSPQWQHLSKQQRATRQAVVERLFEMSGIFKMPVSALFLLVLSLFCVQQSFAAAEPIGELEGRNIRARLQSAEVLGGNGYRLSILVRNRDGNAALPQPEIFALDGPARLVIDLPGVVSRRAEAIDLVNSAVTAMRLGVHNNKTRIVLDIAGNVFPVFSTQDPKPGGPITVDFTLSDSKPIFEASKSAKRDDDTIELLNEFLALDDSSDSQAAGEQLINEKPALKEATKKTAKTTGAVPLAALDNRKRGATKSASPAALATENSARAAMQHAETKGGTVEATSGALKQAQAGQAPEKLIERELEMTPGLEPAPVPVPAPGQGLITAVAFRSKSISGQDALVIEAESFDFYSLSRKEQRKYTLELRNCLFGGKFLQLPHFPPEGFSGIEVVVAEQRAENAYFEIHVEDGVRLAPFRRQGQLWIKVLP